MVKMAVRIEKIRRLTKNSIAVLEQIALRLGDGFGRIDYIDVSKTTGIPRSTIKCCVDTLIRDGVLELEDGKISCAGAIIWFEEAV